MKEIPLTQDQVTQVDDDQYDELVQWKWCAQRDRHTWYAVTKVPDPSKKSGRRQFKMHRLILDAPAGVEVDHRDGNGLNNQLTNLRLATDSENGRNRRLPINSTSGFKGVSWDRNTRKWRAVIRVDGKKHHLGLFTDPIDAALAYDTAARELHGEFAHPNFGLPTIALSDIVGDALDMLAYDDLVAELTTMTLDDMTRMAAV